MKPLNMVGLQNVKDFNSLKLFLTNVLSNFFQLFDKRLTFTDNFNCQILDNVLLSIGKNTFANNLGRVPMGFLVVYKTNEGANIFITPSSEINWNSQTVSFFTNANTYATIIILGG